jgi:hypothetical protein
MITASVARRFIRKTASFSVHFGPGNGAAGPPARRDHGAGG